MAFLEVEDGKHVYYEHHRGSGRPVVLVHGWAANARCWDTVLGALRAADHTVVTMSTAPAAAPTRTSPTPRSGRSPRTSSRSSSTSGCSGRC